MTRFNTFLLAPLFASLPWTTIHVAKAAATEWETKYPMLGTNNLVEMLNYTYDVTVDEDCNYDFTVNFSHNPGLPIGSMETCVPEEIADFDGLPMLAGRAYYDLYPAYVEEATGFNHLSLDYNPCGHPSGGFLSPHYDMHFYMVTLQYRAEEMVCDTIPGIPVCAPEQNTTNGMAFFDLERSDAIARSGGNGTTTDDDEAPLVNMPEGFAPAASDAVIYMGMHSFYRETTPETPQDWAEPTLVFGSHHEVTFFEPMLPLHFVAGEDDHSAEQSIEYVEQTISTLPVLLQSSFDASDKVTTVRFTGKSNVCKAEFDAAKASYESSLLEDDEAVMDRATTFTYGGGGCALLVFALSAIWMI